MPKRSIRSAITFAVAAGAVVAVAIPGTAGADEYPVEIISRPFTLPQGSWQAGADVDTNKDFDATGMALVADYGLIDKLQLGVTYGFTLDDFEAKGDLLARASFLYLSGGTIEGLALATAGYSILAEDPVPLDVGSLFWYTINDKMAVYTVPSVSIALAEDEGGAKPVFLSLFLALAVQPISYVYAEVGTNLANIDISDSENEIFGVDTVPLSITGFFSPNNKLDVGAGISWGDLKEASDTLGFLALVRYRGGI